MSFCPKLNLRKHKQYVEFRYGSAFLNFVDQQRYYFVMRLSCIVLICCLIKTSESWDADDLALFDVVEDVGQNFYELLDVDQA